MIDFINSLFESGEHDGWLIVGWTVMIVLIFAGVFLFNGGWEMLR